MSSPIRRLLATALALLLSAAPPVVAIAADEARTNTDKATPTAFVSLNGEVIAAEQFETALKDAARRKFYHGTPPESEIDQLTREVAFDIVDRILLAAEAKKRGIKPDPEAVKGALERYEQRQASNPRWPEERSLLLPVVRERFETENMIAQLEVAARKVPAPSEDKVREYYKKHPDKFTEPAKDRVSVILLSVDPSSPTEAWQAAETRAGALRLQLTEGGASFADIAREHSSHESADNGGDLGYLHRGMLPDGIQQAIDRMTPGDLSPPTRVLQGVSLFRYDSQQPAKKHDFQRVKDRARDLLERDLQNAAWEGLRTKLRQTAKIQFNTQRYPSLAKQPEPGKQ